MSRILDGGGTCSLPGLILSLWCVQGSYFSTKVTLSSEFFWWSLYSVPNFTFLVLFFFTHGQSSEYVNPYWHIPIQTTGENKSGYLQSPGWQLTLHVAWCLSWCFACIEKSMVIHDTECPYWNLASLNTTNANPYCTFLCHSFNSLSASSILCHPCSSPLPFIVPKGMTRRDGTVCARLRIGHSYLTQLSPKRRTPSFLCQLQWSTDNKPLTNKLWWVCWQ